MKFGLLLATALAIFSEGEATSIKINDRNLLENGNFEKPLLKSGYRFLNSIPGWKTIGGPVEQGVGTTYNRNWGNKVVLELDSHHNYCIAQNVKLSEGIYEFSTSYAAR